ncbi:hypothetical protein ACFLXG_04025 [Chloroflexota bacterium]
MGSRDYRHRETKKTKKDTRKISPISIMPSPAQVEVIKKRKKREEAEEE